MKKLLMIVMLVGVIGMAGAAAQAGAISHNLAGHVLGAADTAGATTGYHVGNWNNTHDAGQWGDDANGGKSAGFVKDDSGAILPTVGITWNSPVTYPAIVPTGGTQGDIWMMNYANLATAAGPGTLTMTGIPYDYYDVVVYMVSNYLTRGVEVTMPGQPTYIGQPTNGGFNGTWIRATSTDPNNATLGASHAVFEDMSGATATITWDMKSVGGYGEGWVTGFQIAETDPPPIPEPAGLGLVGIALLAMRRKRRAQ